MPEDLADLEEPLPAQVALAPGGRHGEAIGEWNRSWPVPLGRAGTQHPSVDWHAVARVMDRGDEEICPRPARAESGMQLGVACDGRRYPDGLVPDVVDVPFQHRQIAVVGALRQQVPPHVGSRPAAGSRRKVDDRDRPVRRSYGGDAPTADAALGRVDDALHEGGHERGLDGVGTLAQRPVGLVDGERMSSRHGVAHAWHPSGIGGHREHDWPEHGRWT